jgi:hypothetical protein
MERQGRAVTYREIRAAELDFYSEEDVIKSHVPIWLMRRTPDLSDPWQGIV